MIVDWIKQQVIEAGLKGCVVGMSGGIDSSVVSVLCKQAFPDNTLGIIMPCYSNDEDAHDARLVAKKFGIKTVYYKLNDCYDKFLEGPSSMTDMVSYKLARANLKSRLRMITLYYFANLHQYMVIGTSNKSEIAIGYVTKYGDGGVDIEPIGHLLKREVRELAKHLGISDKIIQKTPSANLWKGQDLVSEREFSWDDVDAWIMGEELDSTKTEKIKQCSIQSEHKRILPKVFDGGYKCE